MSTFLLLVAALLAAVTQTHADPDANFGHSFADMNSHLSNAELFQLAQQTLSDAVAADPAAAATTFTMKNRHHPASHGMRFQAATTTTPTVNPWVAENITGPLAPQDGTAPTLKVAYAHPLYMRAGVKAMAQRFVANECPTCIIFLISGGVLDPAAMDTWPDERKADVMQLYSTVLPRTWFTGQTGSLNKIMNGWAIKHGTVMQDDLPRQAQYESLMPSPHNDGTIHWAGATWLESARSITFNETQLRICKIDLPPPYNLTRYPTEKSYGWKEHRDIIIALVECGVLEPLIMEECMITPWWISVLHSYSVFLVSDDGVTSGWRSTAFVQAIEEVLWPILSAVARADPSQRMLKRWINWASAIVQEYAASSLDNWPATKPTPIPRSECGLATKVFGMSSHYLGADPMLKLADSAGPVNCLIGWVWSKLATAGPLADRWIQYHFDYSRPEVFAADLAAFSVIPFDSVSTDPTVVARAASVKGQTSARLMKKGRPMNWPNGPLKYTDLLEGWNPVGRMLYDMGWRCDITSTDPAVIRACALMVQNRAATLLEEIIKPDCRFPDDTVSTIINGVRTAAWKTGRNVTCRVSEESVRVLAATPEAHEVIDCVFPKDTVSAVVGGVRIATWKPNLDDTCLVTQASEQLLAADPDANKVIDCVHPQDTKWIDDNCSGGAILLATAIWDEKSVGTTCQVTALSQTTMPVQPTALVCPYVTTNSPTAAGIIAAVALSCILFVGIAVLLVKHQEAEAIKASSRRFSLALLAFCGIMIMAAVTEIGARTFTTCASFVTLMSIGLAGVLACLFVKIWRIASIFLSTRFNTKKLDDGALVPYFAGIMSIFLVMVVTWIVVASKDPTREVAVIDSTESGVRGLVATECNYDQPAVFIVWLTLILLLIVTNLCMGYMVREVDDKFNDTKTLLGIAALTAFIGSVCLVMLNRTQANVDRSVLKALIAIFTSVAIVAIYFGFKLYYVFAKPGGRSSAVPDRTRVADGSTVETAGAGAATAAAFGKLISGPGTGNAHESVRQKHAATATGVVAGRSDAGKYKTSQNMSPPGSKVSTTPVVVVHAANLSDFPKTAGKDDYASTLVAGYSTTPLVRLKETGPATSKPVVGKPATGEDSTLPGQATSATETV